MASTQEDLARLLVTIELSQAKTERQAAAIAAAGERAARKIDGDFRAANANIARSFDVGGKKVIQSIGAQRGAVTNLSFQLNDIATQLSSGTSFFQVMAQQGGQVTQSLMGSGGVLGALRVVGGALFNPFTLATFAITGIAAASAAYFSETSSDAKEATKKIEEHRQSIKAAIDAWGSGAPAALVAYNDELDRLDRLEKKRAGLQAAIGDAQDRNNKILGDFGPRVEKVISLFERFPKHAETVDVARKAWEAYAEKVRAGTATAEDSARIAELLNQTISKLPVGVAKTLAKDFGALADSIDAASERGRELGGVLDGLDKPRQVFSELGTLGGVTSEGGIFRFPEPDVSAWNEWATQGELAANKVSDSLAASMIRNFEGFRSNAYADQKSGGGFSAWRAGFGSDTTTHADGSIETVTAKTIVTLDDAERDLSRRITEFQYGIQKAIGLDTWRSLSEGQQAALSSIAYNYGQLPKSIVAALQGGGGPATVAKAIASLTANPDRRREEAQSYLGGTGLSMGDAGLGSQKKSPADLFNGDVEDVQKRIDLLNAEFGAMSKLNPLINDYGFAVQKAKIEQELLSAAKKAGLEITPELSAKIGTLAENYAKASVSGKQLAESQEAVNQKAIQFNAMGRELLGGFIADLRAGKSAAEAFAGVLDKVVDRLIDVGLNMLFPTNGRGGLFGGMGGGGLLGGMIIPGILHDGGVAGRDGYGHGRSVSPSTFAGAKRYHNGGVAGLMPGEVPAILQRGEVVIPKGGSRGSTETIRVVLQDDSGRMADIADQQIRTSSGAIIQVSVQQSMKTVKGQMPGLMADAQMRRG